MVQRYGESFQRPTDPFTGLPISGAPEMAVICNNRPSGGGYVVLRDDLPLTQAPPTGPGGLYDPNGN